MNIPLEWLREYVEVDASPEAMAERLTLAGLETTVKRERPELPAGVVTAKILYIKKHPQADKLTLCQVIPGEGQEPLAIVCGAPNIKEGDVVPLALVGTVLPGGMTISKSKIRGELSFGMMCSERELGLSEDHAGIMILPPATPLGRPLSEVLGSGAIRFEPEPTPNRPDLLCVLGVARELAAIFGRPLRYPEIKLAEDGPAIASLAQVEIRDYVNCPRYVARLVQGIKVGPSPAWMQQRLEAAGVRAINNIVDVTNYVLLETNQPLHAFDFQKLRRAKIVVRRADAGESFTTLDGKARKLFDDTLLICDGDGPVAVAGVMGGLESEVTEATADVLIESAYFNPVSIRRTAKKLGLPTEASRRFERGIDPLGQVRAADRAAELMARLAGGRICRGVIDAREILPEPKPIRLRPERLNFLLGTELSEATATDCLRRLEIEVKTEGQELTALPPGFRPDLVAEIDLIEEVARISGYDAIPPTLPRFHLAPLRQSAPLQFLNRLRALLVDLGFSEAVNYNFQSLAHLDQLGLTADDPRRQAVTIQNPLSELETTLRTSLVPRLLETLRKNLARGSRGLRIFEFNKVFAPNADLPRETTMLAGLIAPAETKELWPSGVAEGFYEIKGVVEQILAELRFAGGRTEPGESPFLVPGKTGRLMLGKDPAGFFGEVHPRVLAAFEVKTRAFLFDLNFDMLSRYRQGIKPVRPVSRYPVSYRDIAFVVEEAVSAADVDKAVRSLRSELIESAEIFDVYRGDPIPPGRKSLALAVRYQSHERTLTDDEVNALHARLGRVLEEKLNAKLR
jgi:phenylalanyl-tRNA synthetase beta chain